MWQNSSWWLEENNRGYIRTEQTPGESVQAQTSSVTFSSTTTLMQNSMSYTVSSHLDVGEFMETLIVI